MISSYTACSIVSSNKDYLSVVSAEIHHALGAVGQVFLLNTIIKTKKYRNVMVCIIRLKTIDIFIVTPSAEH